MLQSSEEEEEGIKQISLGSITIIILVIFEGTAWNLLKGGLVFEGFNPCSSLPSVATNDKEQFQCEL